MQNAEFYELCLNHPDGTGFALGALRDIVQHLCNETARYSGFIVNMLIWHVRRAAGAADVMHVAAGLQLAAVVRAGCSQHDV